MKKILGADLSISSTGLVVVSSKGIVKHQRVRPKGPDKLCYEERMAYIVKEVLEYAKDVHLTVIEGAAWGKHTAAFNLGMLNGVVRLSLWSYEHPFALVSPPALKKHATGHGNATKEMMVKAAEPFFKGEKYSEDEADAYFLADFGLNFYDNLVESVAH